MKLRGGTVYCQRMTYKVKGDGKFAGLVHMVFVLERGYRLNGYEKVNVRLTVSEM
jgi:hypothetical protein